MFILAQPPGQQKLKTVDPAVFLCPAARGLPRPFFHFIYERGKNGNSNLPPVCGLSP
jgi:hypothetical protein